jgi:hypothetical protein
MASYPGGADKAELEGGLLTFRVEQSKPWAEIEPANEIMNRVAACLNSIAENEANTFAPGAKNFRIAIVYEDDLPEEVERAFEKLRQTASANYGVEITWGRLHPNGA